MSVTTAQAVRDREFTADELEQMRLLLSTFRDGAGQRLKDPIGYMPDYLAFERVTAMVLGGDTNENKGIFDVAVPRQGGKAWGVSCKMATAQPKAKQSWFMEMSNSSKKLTDALTDGGIAWQTSPELAGPILIETVQSWHEDVKAVYDVPASKYLLLAHDRSWSTFEVACFNIDVISISRAANIHWSTEGKNPQAPSSVAGYISHPATKVKHRLWQWYANSGGQLKFYPPRGWQEWCTGPFSLEPCEIKNLKDKVDEYWPEKWPGRVSPEDPEAS